jgi:hypothetical protein
VSNHRNLNHCYAKKINKKYQINSHSRLFYFLRGDYKPLTAIGFMSSNLYHKKFVKQRKNFLISSIKNWALQANSHLFLEFLSKTCKSQNKLGKNGKDVVRFHY